MLSAQDGGKSPRPLARRDALVVAAALLAALLPGCATLDGEKQIHQVAKPIFDGDGKGQAVPAPKDDGWDVAEGASVHPNAPADDPLPPLPPENPGEPQGNAKPPLFDDDVAPAACPSCGGAILGGPSPYPHLFGSSVCASGGCKPGKKPCYPFEAHTFVGRFFGRLYECLCCPDPCYKPHWIPEANAAFFVDFARPQTMQRFRVDYGDNLVFPDRAEYFWARDDGKGKGPRFPKFRTTPRTHRVVTPTPTTPSSPAGRPPGFGNTGGSTGTTTPTGPAGRPPGLTGAAATAARAQRARAGATTRHVPTAEASLDYGQLSLYNEAATGRASFFVEIPYRSVDPLYSPGHAGFADMNLGTKSVLLDCELLLLTFQFKTYLPIGNSFNGLGTGHVSLEPSLLGTLRISDSSYLQGQLSEWIPLGGDPGYQGSILHYHGSFNQVLCRVTPDSPLIGTFEANGWSFQDGGYTDPFLGPQKASGFTYFSVGPGLRMVICQNIDFGIGTAFAVTDPHWESQLYRFELRILY